MPCLVMICRLGCGLFKEATGGTMFKFHQHIKYLSRTGSYIMECR